MVKNVEIETETNFEFLIKFQNKHMKLSVYLSWIVFRLRLCGINSKEKDEKEKSVKTYKTK